MPAHEATKASVSVEPSASRVRVDAPPVRVTVLEDRAQVERAGTVHLAAGMNRLSVEGVSPLLQDVSLQARAIHDDGTATSATVRLVRARRVLAHERPEAVAELEAELDALQRRLQEQEDRRDRARQRHTRLAGMLASAAAELPEDASWGRGDASTWRHAFDRLFERSREEDMAALEAVLAHERLRDDWLAVLRRRNELLGPDAAVTTRAEVDVVVDTSGDARIELVYVVPSALWRPVHRAELVEGDGAAEVRWTPRACVWQRTGEDWSDVQLVLSTARTSAGTEPPLLRDDALTVQRKQEQVRVALRDVAIQRAGPPDDAPAPKPDLPGVDDGGEARHLDVPGRVRVPSTGRPTFFDLAELALPCDADIVAMPEVAPRAIRRVRFTLDSPQPLLPGPVELLRNGGPFATAAVDFTAPGARQELSFGPDDDLRVRRASDLVSEKTDPDDKWTRRVHRVRVFLSNVGTGPRTLQLVERVPVSEIRAVRIEGVAATPEAAPDDDGHVHWTLTLEAGQRQTVELRYTLATAPDVALEGV